MPFEKFEDAEAIDNERRKAVAKSIRIISVEELKKPATRATPWRPRTRQNASAEQCVRDKKLQRYLARASVFRYGDVLRTVFAPPDVGDGLRGKGGRCDPGLNFRRDAAKKSLIDQRSCRDPAFFVLEFVVE